MQIQFTAGPDPVLIAAAVRRRLRRPVLLARCAGWAALLAAAFLLVTRDSLHPALLVAGVALAAGVPLVLLNRAARRAIWDGRVTTFEISDAGVASADPRSCHSYAWAALKSVEELPGQLLFTLGDMRFLPVPTAGLTTAQIDQILDVAAAGGLAVSRLRMSAMSGS
ncbi:YcxB family protein [Actinoplanes sp. NPDC023714]|uniref:YcxB family protein n=1 Tax=Actinoplanes sp. NPDC023714 TaxID=3154322 RepID=UPI0033E6AD42